MSIEHQVVLKTSEISNFEKKALTTKNHNQKPQMVCSSKWHHNHFICTSPLHWSAILEVCQKCPYMGNLHRNNSLIFRYILLARGTIVLHIISKKLSSTKTQQIISSVHVQNEPSTSIQLHFIVLQSFIELCNPKVLTEQLTPPCLKISRCGPSL